MKKRWTAFFLAFLLGLGLTACGKTPGPDTNTDAPPSAADSAEDTRQQTSAPFSADYWTAVRHESYDAMNDCMKTSAMPTEAWWADLYLNEDGTAQFRDVLGSYYNTSLLDGNWWLGADSTLRLTGTMNTGEPLTLDGRIESTDSLAIETPYGDTFYFAPAERPGPGGEMGIADLYGTWRMTPYEEDCREYSPGEEHIASMLCFDRLWSDLLEGYVMRADWYHAAGLDTDTPQYRSEKHLLAEQIEEPLMPGLSNETWSGRLTDEETGAAFFAAVTSRNSLLVRMPYEKNGGAGIRTVTYMRSSGFLPPTLENAMTGEAEKSLIFYWRDPPTEVKELLSVIPMNALEPNGQNKLLLVGRGDREVRRVLAALDVTPAVAAEAAEQGADLIVAHHPVMNVRWHEREMQTLRDDTRLGGLLTYLVRQDLSVICMHTNLDAAEGGVNDCLAQKLGLSGTIPLNEEKIGRIGTLSCEIPLDQFLHDVVKSLGCRGLRSRAGGRPVPRVAVGGGACGEYIPQALAQAAIPLSPATCATTTFWIPGA